MIDQEIQKTIEQKMNRLSPLIREAIQSSGWERKILTIGRKYGLHVDQLEVLQTELSLAVLGLSSREEFVSETMREARINRETMSLMVSDINHEIFSPIREKIRKNQKEQEKIAQRDLYSSEPKESTGQSKSGLDALEEQELAKHGVSFSDDEDEVKQDQVQAATTEEFSKQENIQKDTRLDKPLILNKEKKTDFSNSHINLDQSKSKNPSDDFSIDNIPGLDINNQELKQKEFDSSKVSNQISSIQSEQVQAKKIPGEEIDLSKLAGAKTSDHQNIINQSSNTGYVKGDPYREPVE